MAETILTWQPYAIALAGGLLPSLVWLWFWMRQDRLTPEPDGLIALSFFAGMIVVFLVYLVGGFFVSINQTTGGLMVNQALIDFANWVALSLSLNPLKEQTLGVATLAFVEELAKFSTVFFIAFKSKYFDEPKDAIIYLITAALGFAAMENTLYLFKTITHGGVVDGLSNISTRFIGATTVHIVSSAFIGLAIALAFYAPRAIRTIAATLGILIATLLHTYFNLSIISSDTTLKQLIMFTPFWAAIVGIIILLAIIERLTKTNKIIN